MPQSAFESVLKCATDAILDGQSSLPKTRFLTAGDIESLCARDTESVKEELRTTRVSAGQTRAAVVPSADLINLLQGRAEFIASKLFGKVNEHRGAINQSEDSWIYWYHDFRKQQLAVLRVHLPETSAQNQPEQVASLFLDALKEASVWDLPKVTVWDANPAVLQALDLLKDQHRVEVTSGQRYQRSIPSLRWAGDERAKKVTLHCNEFYAWS